MEILQEENETGTWIRVEWYLNDEFIISTISDGTQDWKVQEIFLLRKVDRSWCAATMAHCRYANGNTSNR